MNTDIKSEWFAFHITDENKAELASGINPDDVMPAVHGGHRTFVPGHIAVYRLISAHDPFSDSLGNRMYSVWIATQEQFDSKFTVTGRNWLYSSRLEITPK